MRPKTITLQGDDMGESYSHPYPINWRAGGVGVEIALGFTTDGSTTSFTVQHTLDAPSLFESADAYNALATWMDHADMTAMTANDDGNYDYPIRAIRLKADGNGEDTGSLTIIQAG